MALPFPRAPQSPNLLPFKPSVADACFRLVVMCVVVDWRPPKATMYFFILFFPSRKSSPQTMGRRPRIHPYPTRASSPTTSPPRTPTFGWLLCSPMKWRPSKAQAPSLSLFFDASPFGAPNKGADDGERTPDAARLPWAHGESRRQDLGAPLPYPWR